MIRGKPAPGVKKIGLEPTLNASIHNRFDVEVVDAYTGDVKKKAVGYNTICNGLWTKMLSFSAYFAYIHYGGGSGTPSPSDTSLFNYFGGQQCVDTSDTVDSVHGIYSVKRSIQLTASTAVGKTITEVGIAHGSDASTLCTHAMLKDMNGNPISLEKSDTDIVNIYATVYVHIDTGGYGGAFYPWPQITTRNPNLLLGWLCGVSNISFNTAWFGHGDTAWYNGVNYGNGYPSGGVYKGATCNADATNRRVSITVNRLEASEGNFGGIRLIDLGYMGVDYNYSRLTLVIYPNDTWFSSNRVTSESVGTGDGVTKDFSLDFGFAKNAKVYVDGVETQDFTLDYVPYSTTDIAQYMRSITLDSTLEVMIPRPVTLALNGFGDTAILYNPLWEFGISNISMSQSWNLWVSDDLKTWIKIYTGDIPDQYAYSKFWKLQWVSGPYGRLISVTPKSAIPKKALHFNTAPASGSVILVDYDCDCIPKDANHVFDMTVTIQLGEYTESQ